MIPFLSLTFPSRSTGPGVSGTDAQTSFSQAASASTSAGGQEKKESTASLQIAGQVVEENDYVRLGAYHTLDLEGELPCLKSDQRLTVANRDFRLTKTSGWDSVALERISESTKEGRGAEVGAVVCGEGELTRSWMEKG